MHCQECFLTTIIACGDNYMQQTLEFGKKHFMASISTELLRMPCLGMSLCQLAVPSLSFIYFKKYPHGDPCDNGKIFTRVFLVVYVIPNNNYEN